MLTFAYISLALLLSNTDVAVHWSFDSIDNGTAHESANNLHAQVHGAQHQQGALHGGLYFDGIDDYADVTAINGVQKILGSLDEGTISAWFRFDHIPSYAEILDIFYFGDADDFSDYGTTADGYTLEVGHFSSQSRLYWTCIEVDENLHSDVPLCWSTHEQLAKDRWYHIVSATDSTGTRVYLDNIEIYDGSNLVWNFGDAYKRRFLADITRQEVLWFGKGPWNHEHQFYHGMIDEITIWRTALTPEQVQAEYERVANVGSFVIADNIENEFATLQPIVQFNGLLENIVKFKWQVNGAAWSSQVNESLLSEWSLQLQIPETPGRHEIKILGQNASGKNFIDSRFVIRPDLNEDGVVNIHDLLLMIGAWGDCDCIEDFTGDGRVSIADILILIGAWG